MVLKCMDVCVCVCVCVCVFVCSMLDAAWLVKHACHKSCMNMHKIVHVVFSCTCVRNKQSIQLFSYRTCIQRIILV